jgi:hypothetical protein
MEYTAWQKKKKRRRRRRKEGKRHMCGARSYSKLDD